MKRWIAGVLGALLVTLGVAGCVGEPLHGKLSPSATAVSARPTVPKAPRPGYDTSAKARTAFFGWWAYEVQSPKDAAVSRAALYSGGAYACSLARGKTTPAQSVAMLRTRSGLSQSGTEALERAAITGLCPDAAQYETPFDSKVNAFATSLTGVVEFNVEPLSDHDFGLFMKTACGQLRKQPATIGQYMAHRDELVLSQVASQPVLYVLIKHAAQAGCPATVASLPYAVRSAA